MLTLGKLGEGLIELGTIYAIFMVFYFKIKILFNINNNAKKKKNPNKENFRSK